MSAKKGRAAKQAPAPQNGVQKKMAKTEYHDLLNFSAVLEGLQQNYSNPLHSTALEEDLAEEAQINKENAGRKDNHQTVNTTFTKQEAAIKEQEEQKKKRGRKGSGGKDQARPEEEGERKNKRKRALQGARGESDAERKESDPAADLQKTKQPAAAGNNVRRLVGKKPAKRRSAGQTSAAREVKKQLTKKGNKKESDPASGKPSEPQSQEESDTDTPQQRRNRVLSSDEEVPDEDTSWKPSPKKAKVLSFRRTRKSSSDRSKSRKSSSGSTSAEAEKADTDAQRKRRRQGETESEVVLDAFLDFCEQYRDSVESKDVKKSIDCFSSHVKEQLLEKISSYKSLRVLKRENIKVGSSINKKRQKLLDAKYELMRAEGEVQVLLKEKAELKLRLDDLRRGQAFLHDISELNRQYLDYRHKHPKEKETYGASSLPALLLETKYFQSAEHRPRGVNNQEEKRQKKKGTRK